MFKVKIDPQSNEFRKGSLFGLAGFALELLGAVANIPYHGGETSSYAGTASALVGLVFFVVGVYYLAQSKGRSPAWAVLGIFSLVGWILVAFIEDHTEVVGEAADGGVVGADFQPIR